MWNSRAATIESYGKRNPGRKLVEANRVSKDDFRVFCFFFFPKRCNVRCCSFSGQRRRSAIGERPRSQPTRRQKQLWFPLVARSPSFPHIHFITQPHVGRFQMAQGKHSWATLIRFIYLGTNSVWVCACVCARLGGGGLAVWSHVIQVRLSLLPIRSRRVVCLIWQGWSNHSQLSHKLWHNR